MLAVMVSWVIFRFTNLQLAWTLIRSMFGLNGNPLTGFAAEIQLQSHSVLLVVAIVASTPLMKKVKIFMEDFVAPSDKLSNAWNVALYSVIPVILLLLSTAGLVGDSYNPFIYFQF